MPTLPCYNFPEGIPPMGVVLLKENLGQATQALNQIFSGIYKPRSYKPLFVFREIREIEVRIQKLRESVKEEVEKGLVLRIEKNPSLLCSKEFLTLMKDYTKMSPEEEESLKEGLEEFAKSKWGKSMDEGTRRFLIGEILYLGLKLKKEGSL